MENNEYLVDLREKWQVISFDDFIENVQDVDIYEKWLDSQGFDRHNSYLEISVKIKAR